MKNRIEAREKQNALAIELQERLRDTNSTECVAEKITENLRRNFSDFRIPE